MVAVSNRLIHLPGQLTKLFCIPCLALIVSSQSYLGCSESRLGVLQPTNPHPAERVRFGLLTKEIVILSKSGRKVPNAIMLTP